MRQTLSSFAVTLLLSVTASLGAQAPTVAASQVGASRCTYATCALRLERTMFGGEQVRAGEDGVAVRMGFSGGALYDLVAGVPEAQRYADLGEKQRFRGNVALTLGTVLISAVLTSALSSPALSGSGSGDNLAQLLVVSAAGTGAVLYGGSQAARATQSFSRAIWLYNQSLPR